MSTRIGCDDPLAAMLGALRSPTRNRYFYGKMLDAHHFKLEQDYVNQMRWLMNRLSLGTGVLCGLEVSVDPDGKEARIKPGVAVDGLGREIIVPALARFDFKKMRDETAKEAPSTAAVARLPLAPAAVGRHGPAHAAEPGVEIRRPPDSTEVGPSYTIYLCYHECCVEPTPVLVTDECEPERRCEHGLIRERYCIEVKPGHQPPPPNGFPDFCTRLFKPKLSRLARLKLLCDERLPICGGIKAGDSRPIDAADDRPCAPPAEVCVPIATLVQDGHSGWTVRPCPPPRLLFSNEILFEMIMCLADCCSGDHTTPATEKPYPNVVALDPTPGVTYTPTSPDINVYNTWAFRKQNDGWRFKVTFNQNMNVEEVNVHPDRWLHAYLVFNATSAVTTHQPLPMAWVVCMSLKSVEAEAPVPGTSHFSATYQIVLPTADQTANARGEVREVLGRLRNSIDIGHVIKEGFRFIILMHTKGQHVRDVDGRLLDAACDGIGRLFDQPQAGNRATREELFITLSSSGSVAQYPASQVLAPLPATIERPPTPLTPTMESWFSAALDFAPPVPPVG